MDERFISVAIDEPELGLSTNLQRKLADIIIRDNKKAELFPHNPNIILSTHSHVFLDKTIPTNNYVVSRNNDKIHARQCTSFSELHDIQFRLLGNDLNELFLPDAVVFVEGETDKMYLEKIFDVHLKGVKIVVQQCGGDISKRLSYWISSLGDMQLSPYRNRTFIVSDSVKQSGLDRTISQAGLPKQSSIDWSGNGIEHVYPSDLLSQIYRITLNTTDDLSISGDIVSAGGLSYKKMELCQKVCSLLNSDTQLPSEVVSKLVEPLRAATRSHDS